MSEKLEHCAGCDFRIDAEEKYAKYKQIQNQLKDAEEIISDIRERGNTIGLIDKAREYFKKYGVKDE